MRTRSGAHSGIVDHAATERTKKETETRKRKRTDADSDLGNAGDRSKRSKIAGQSPASQVKSTPKNKRHSSGLRKRGAAAAAGSMPNASGEKSRASLKKAITQKHGTKESSVLIRPIKRRHRNEKSTEETASEQCSSRNKSSLKRPRMKDSPLPCHNDVQHHEENMSIHQGEIDGQENLTPTLSGEDEHQMVGTFLSTQEPVSVQCQSHEDGCHNGPKTILSQVKTDKCSRLRHKEDGDLMPTQVSRQPKSRYSRKCINGAKLRWKNLALRILSAKTSPKVRASSRDDLGEDFLDTGEQIKSSSSSQNKTHSLPKKRRKSFNVSAVKLRPRAARIRQKVCKQQLSLAKRMKTWLTEAKFSQSAREAKSNNVGEEYIITEDERHAFAQSVVKSCQKNSNMRTVFLESVKMLTLSGLMQAAASNLLQQGPCEEAQNVMNAWADFKEENVITKTLPMNLLNAVNQLHEKRGDLSTKLNTPNAVGICAMSLIDEQTWKFQLPGLPCEDENPIVTKSLGQEDTAV